MARVICTLALVALVASSVVADVALKPPGATNSSNAQSLKEKFDSLDKMAKSVSWHKPPVPAHIVKAQAERVLAMPVVETGGCGSLVGTSHLKKSALALFQKAPEHEGRNSFAKPGVGGDQKLADNGLSEHGQVSGQEPFVKVLKDGYFEVGCYHDSMLEFGDKFGDDKDKYGSKASHANVAVAKYKDLVLKDEQKSVKPSICFEFCRTLPGMVFFGIHNGDECYCTPYFSPQAGDDSKCDVPCAGDSTMMCGNADGKSTVWEMHLCDSTAEDLGAENQRAEQALTYFYEAASMADEIGKLMTDSGAALQEVGGLSGSPSAGDLGMAAKVAGGDLTKAFINGRKSYELMHAAFKKGKDLESADFSVASKATEAEAAMKGMQDNTGKVLGFAAEIHDLLRASYPAVDFKVFGDEAEKGDAVAEQLQKERESGDFRDAAYAFDKTLAEAQASSCSGKAIGAPMLGLGLNGCGVACEATVYPSNCQAFANYKVDGSDDLCFLFSEVQDVERFEKPASFLQAKATKAGSNAAAACKVKLSANYKPKGELKKLSRCFGGCSSDFSLPEDMTDFSLPSSYDKTEK
jgi:hypothetical protein